MQLCTIRTAFRPKLCTGFTPPRRLTDLTRKGAPNVLVWSDIHDQAFQTLKSTVCNPPVLRLPDMSKPFLLQTDASSEGIGAILLQEEGGVKHPVAFASKKLLPRERNYSTTEREALAIVWGVQKYEMYLLGAHFYLAIPAPNQISEWKVDEVVPHSTALPFHSSCHKRI